MTTSTSPTANADKPQPRPATELREVMRGIQIRTRGLVLTEPEEANVVGG